MIINDFLPDNKQDRRLLKAVIYSLFMTSKEVSTDEAIIRASERFMVRVSDIDLFIEDLFSVVHYYV